MTLTPAQLDEVIEQYCNRVVDEMDTMSMEQMLYDLLLEYSVKPTRMTWKN